jgi:hypothetical protein
MLKDEARFLGIPDRVDVDVFRRDLRLRPTRHVVQPDVVLAALGGTNGDTCAIRRQS